MYYVTKNLTFTKHFWKGTQIKYICSQWVLNTEEYIQELSICSYLNTALIESSESELSENIQYKNVRYTLQKLTKVFAFRH